MEKLDTDKDWKPQTVLTMLVRMIEKHFSIRQHGTQGKIKRER